MNEGINLSDEYRDLARYFRLSILRDRGVLPPVGLKEIEEIVARNERAQAIEESRKQLEDKNIEQEDYDRVVTSHRAALAEAIKEASKQTEEIVERERAEISEEFKDLARYFRLSILRNNGQLPPVGLQELEEIVERNERSAAIEEARNRLVSGELSEENYERLYAAQREALANEIKRVYEENKDLVDEQEEVEEPEVEQQVEEEQEIQEEQNVEEEKEIAEEEHQEEKKVEPKQEVRHGLSEEFSDLARYFRLSILRNNGQLPPTGLKEIEDIVERNERSAAIEEARNQLMNGNIKEEDYERVVRAHREALAEAIKEANFTREEEPAPVVEQEEVKEDKVEEPKKEEPKKEEPHKLNITDEFRDLARYFRLSMLRDQKMLPPVGLQELVEIAERNERAGAVEAAHKEMEAGRLSKENFDKVHDVHRAALAEEIKRASSEANKGQVSRPVEEAKNEPIVHVTHEPIEEAKNEPIVHVTHEPINNVDIEKYRIALRALKAYKEYTDCMKQLGMTNIDELTQFLGLRGKTQEDPGKTR